MNKSRLGIVTGRLEGCITKCRLKSGATAKMFKKKKTNEKIEEKEKKRK
jgi:hypothetical protein